MAGFSMVLATKILKPGPARISRIGQNFTLPRSVPLPVFLGSIFGAIFGLIVGLFAFAIIGFIGLVPMFALGGGLAGSQIVTWQPWKGESAFRVLQVSRSATLKKTVFQCPGTFLPTDSQIEGEVCEVCKTFVQITSDKVAKRHTWKRAMYVGVQRVEDPLIGPIVIIPGSIPNPWQRTNVIQEKTRQKAKI